MSSVHRLVRCSAWAPARSVPARARQSIKGFMALVTLPRALVEAPLPIFISSSLELQILSDGVRRRAGAISPVVGSGASAVPPPRP